MIKLYCHLHCKYRQADKVYDIFLEQQLNTMGTTYEIYALSGRKGGKLTKQNKYLGRNYEEAVVLFNNLIEEKVDKRNYDLIHRGVAQDELLATRAKKKKLNPTKPLEMKLVPPKGDIRRISFRDDFK